jgi:two-component system, cell cycle sensor histidine kinase and response regulator CckA
VTMPQTEKPCEGSGAGSQEARHEDSAGAVLVVDDDARVRLAVSRLLELLGYKVRVAGSGREALRAYAQDPGGVACVLLDQTMPDMDGVETFRRLQELNPDVRVILASGYAPETLQLGSSGPPVQFLHKPFGEEDLRLAIETAVKGTHGSSR